MGLWGFSPRPPHLSILFTFNRPRDTSHYSTNIKHFPGGGGGGASLPDPPIYPSIYPSYTFNKP